MYRKFYGFKEKPFGLCPDPNFLFLSSKHRMALNYLEYGLVHELGFVLLTGDIGTGKTTLIKKFLKQIPDGVEVAVVFNTNVSSEQLLELILDELEIEVPPGGKVASLHALNRFLIEKDSLGQRVLLIVDEAQSLSPDALEEIRMLTNLQTDRHSLLQILFVGQQDLRVKLQHPLLTQLSQRIGVSYHLYPLDLEETADYISHRIRTAGGKDDQIFTREAVQRVFHHSGGIARTINNLCDVALVYGLAEELEHIDGDVIDLVVKDMKEHGVFVARSDTGSAWNSMGVSRSNGGIARRLDNMEKRINQLANLIKKYVHKHPKRKRV